MSYLTAVLLGLVRGVTEFLPISGSGHSALLQTIFHVEQADLFFDAFWHIGTLISVFLVYRRDLRAVLRGGLGLLGLGKDRGRTTRRNADRRRMAVFIVTGCLPLLLVIPVYGHVSGIYQSTAAVSLLLILNGLILYLSDRVSGGAKGLREATGTNALAVGLAQALAVLPGLSRSGLTISAGLLCGFSQRFAVRFSVLLSVPAVIAAAVVSFGKAAQTGLDLSALPMYLSGMAAAAVSGYFSIRLIRYLAGRRSLGGFAYYCWGAGIVALILSLIA